MKKEFLSNVELRNQSIGITFGKKSLSKFMIPITLFEKFDSETFILSIPYDYIFKQTS